MSERRSEAVDEGLGLRKAKGHWEVPGDFNGYVLTVGGVVKGEIEVDTLSGEMRFKWASSTVAWPSSFKLEKRNGRTVPTTTHEDKYTHGPFPSTSDSYDVSGCQWKIVFDGTTVGWLHRSGSATTWYAVPSEVDGGYYDADELSFEPNDASGLATAVEVVDTAL